MQPQCISKGLTILKTSTYRELEVKGILVGLKKARSIISDAFVSRDYLVARGFKIDGDTLNCLSFFGLGYSKVWNPKGIHDIVMIIMDNLANKIWFDNSASGYYKGVTADSLRLLKTALCSPVNRNFYRKISSEIS